MYFNDLFSSFIGELLLLIILCWHFFKFFVGLHCFSYICCSRHLLKSLLFPFRWVILFGAVYYTCSLVLSWVRLFATPWTVAYQAPLSMKFSRQEYWSGLPFFPSWGLPDTGIKPASPESPALQADSLPAETYRSWKLLYLLQYETKKGKKSRVFSFSL